MKTKVLTILFIGVLLILTACQSAAVAEDDEPPAPEEPEVSAQIDEPSETEEPEVSAESDEPSAPEEAELGVESKWMASRFTSTFVPVYIVFEPGDKCTLEGHKYSVALYQGAFGYKIYVKDDQYENYMVAISTITEEGKTIEDLKAHTQAAMQPSYTDLWHFTVVGPNSVSLISDLIDPPKGELYFTCMVQGPDEWKIIDTLGPFEVPGP